MLTSKEMIAWRKSPKNIVVAALGHLKERLSRIEVHLADVNAAKGGDDDIHCAIEARPEGMKPHTVTHADANVEAALCAVQRRKSATFSTANSASSRSGG
jgi:hypothetical protein